MITNRIDTVRSVSLGLLLTLGLCSPALTQDPAKPKTEAKPNFDKVGPQVGDQLPALSLHNSKGEAQLLSDAWRGGPTLLVTSSLTCPKSRSRWPELKAIIEKYGDKLNVVIVYVIEAHPVGSVCPYKGVEDITPENERDGILRKQPANLEDRIELAQEFKRYLRIGTPIYIDNLKNEAWKGLGAAPNLALLVDDTGVVVSRQGWFEGKSTQAEIDRYLSVAGVIKDREEKRLDGVEGQPGNGLLNQLKLQDYDLRDAIRDKETKELASILKQAPGLANYIFPARPGHPQETTALMEAVTNGNLASVKLLLTQGADVRAQTASFDSALQMAAQDGRLEIVKLLLSHKADPNFPRIGASPLHEAALSGHLEVVKVLKESGSRSDMFVDVALGDIEAVRKTLTADPSFALRADGADRLPLDYAAANGQLQIAKLLLDSGSPVVEEQRVRTAPPLHRAIERRDVAMVTLLLEAKSSPDTMVGHGGESSEWTPALHLAVEMKNVEIVKLLLKYKPKIEARDTYSRTALHVAARGQQTEIVELLLQAGAKVNALQLGFSLPCGSGDEETASNNTPLHYAAAWGDPATINALITAGAKLEARNVQGVTPLMATIKPLIYSGVDKDSRLPKIEALLAAGADINARDKMGQTILSAALAQQASDKAGDQSDLPAVIALLKKHGAKSGAPRAKK